MAQPAPPESLARWHPKVRQLYDYWTSIHPASGRLPGRAHFDPMRVPRLLPHLVLVDVEGRPPRFRYRLIGTRMVEALGANFTGQWLDEAHASDDGSPKFPRYSGVVTSGVPDWRRGKPLFASYIEKCTELERLFLPLAANGADIDMILTVTVFFDVDGREL